MSGTNPGTWPDLGRGEKMSEIMTTPELFGQMVSSSPVPVGPLYTASDLARAREEGRREGQKKMLNDVQRWWRCACETHPVRSQREMDRHQFFMTALNELQYPSALLAEGKKEQSDE